ncbi:hypothetical protein LHGZ1_0649 [Laribacter hongkongensis]|uniref:Uncharacterized protein n=1 Tax=Laribacter hongkongensis TaxID=168471 RepID=A0A248LF79_9NEIS|nr:hypothetical protein LHGZ1_0649 [Laribacter hongkongensis]
MSQHLQQDNGNAGKTGAGNQSNGLSGTQACAWQISASTPCIQARIAGDLCVTTPGKSESGKLIAYGFACFISD